MVNFKILLSLLLFPSLAFADYCPLVGDQTGKIIKYPGNQCDPFSLTEGRAGHMLGEFAIVTTGYMIMRKYEYSKLESILLPSLAGTLIGMTKEVAFDTLTSGGDLIANQIGVLSGVLVCVSFGF